MRWTGTGDVVIAVPEQWRTETNPCASPEGPVVQFIGPAWGKLDCGDYPTRGVSSVMVASARSHLLREPVRAMRRETRTHGLRVLSAGPPCPLHPRGACVGTFAVAGTDARFRVTYRGPDPRTHVAAIRNSVRRLPHGYTTVPLIEYGTSRNRAVAVMKDVGLRGHAPGVDYPHYITGTTPETGTVVPVGSRVELSIGDG